MIRWLGLGVALIGLAACAEIVGADFGDDYRLGGTAGSTSATGGGGMAATGGGPGVGGTLAQGGMGGRNDGGMGGAGGEELCGNGMPDPGELCDGDCPTMPVDCVDGLACTTDSIMGSAAMCDAVCDFAPIAACVSNDDCCPAGCVAPGDLDCPNEPLDVLVYGTDGAAGPVTLNLMNAITGTGRFGAVDYFDAAQTIPALLTMHGYDTVVVFANHNGWQDPTMAGDRLADYVDQGGNVVVLMGAGCAMFALAGRFMTSDYFAFNIGINFLPEGSSIDQVHEMGSPLFAGANPANVSNEIYCTSTVATGAVLVATWGTMSNGSVPAIARRTRPNSGHRVDLNLFHGADQR